MSQSSRREFIIAVAALWQAAVLRAQEHHHVSGAGNATSPYTFAFLNQEQRQILSILMDRFVPADERSHGAVGAKVDEYIDFVLANGDGSVQTVWRNGLARFGQAIHGKDRAGVDQFLQQQAEHEFAPASDNAAFFVILKAAITEGFYTSEIGIVQELGYKGMTYQPDFEGCTHGAHRTPENWRPRLQQAKEA